MKRVVEADTGMDKGWSKRLRNIMILVIVAFIILICSFFYTQIINGKRLKEEARDQQLYKKRIGAKRGQILDRNGEVLAQSVDVDTVSISPKSLEAKKDKEIDKNDLAKRISEIFGEDEKKVLDKINSDKDTVIVASKAEKEKINEFKKYLEEKEIVSGVSIDKDIKREYPYKAVASNLIGFVGADNEGQEGIERKLNSVLMGREGRIVAESDLYKNPINENPEQLINPEDGKNVYLTIDIKVQEMLERHLKEAVENNNGRDGIAIVMDPKDSSILAIANYPNYDLTNPRVPIDMDIEKWNSLSEKEQLNKLFDMWKCKGVSDIYDPGSTFKIITSAIGLEEGVVETDTAGDFLCTGVQKVYDAEIRCWRHYNPHGYLSLRQALENSCNPAFIQLGQRIGVETFYKYLKAFGLLEKTGVDILGESSPIFHGEKKTGPVELATMSFGQRFQITPIQFTNAICSIANGGTLMKPKVVYKIENTEIGSQEVKEKEEIRRVVSEETSEQVLDIMRTTVTNGTGKSAQVEGYNVGGKSGTSEPVYGDTNGEYIASFVAVVPTESPEYVVLLIVRDPKGKSRQGGEVAAPVVGNILKELLEMSKSVEKEEDNNIANEEEIESVEIDNVVGKTAREAKMILQQKGFEVSMESVTTPDEIKVVSQSPESGISVPKGTRIYLVTSESERDNNVIVPDFKGNSIRKAKELANELGITLIIEGKGYIKEQDVEPESEVQKGKVVRCVAGE